MIIILQKKILDKIYTALLPQDESFSLEETAHDEEITVFYNATEKEVSKLEDCRFCIKTKEGILTLKEI